MVIGRLEPQGVGLWEEPEAVGQGGHRLEGMASWRGRTPGFWSCGRVLLAWVIWRGLWGLTEPQHCPQWAARKVHFDPSPLSPVIRLIQNEPARYPFHQRPPTYLRAQRYKYWFSQPGEQR